MFPMHPLVDLTEYERLLVERNLQGEPVDFSGEQVKPPIKGTLLRELLLSSHRSDFRGRPGLPLPGLRVTGARITGGLNCEDFAKPGEGLPTLVLEDCVIEGQLNLAGARIARLSINKSRFTRSSLPGCTTEVDKPSLNLREVEIDGPFDFSRISPLHHDDRAWIDARGGLFHGQITGTDAHLSAPQARAEPEQGNKRYALWLSDVQIHGSLMLINLVANGGVSIGAAHVRGNVWLCNGKLTAGEDDALNAQNARVGGSLVVDKGFEAIGSVWLVGAQIGSSVQFGTRETGSSIEQPEAILKPRTGVVGSNARAIVAGGITIGTDLLMRGVEVRGQVRLQGAIIGGDLDFRLVNLAWPETNHPIDKLPPAFVADGIRVARDVIFDDARICGGLGLSRANIGGELTMKRCSLIRREATGEGLALCLANASIGKDAIFGPVPESAEALARGQIDTELNGDRLETELARARAGAAFVEGKVDLTGAAIGGDLLVVGTRLTNLTRDGRGVALAAERMRVRGSVVFGGGFHASGEVKLNGAEIGGDLECRFANFDNPNRLVPFLYTSNAWADNPDGQTKARHMALSAKDMKISSNVHLRGMEVFGNISLERLQLTGSLRWEALESAERHGLKVSSRGSQTGCWVDLRMAQIGTTLKARSLFFVDDVVLQLGGARISQLEFRWPKGWGVTSGASQPERLLRLELDGLRYDRFVFEQSDVPESDCRNRENAAKWLNCQIGERSGAGKSPGIPPKSSEPSRNFSPHPYRQLASVLRAQGDEDCARHISVEERKKTPHSNWLFKGLWKIYGVCFGYGYKPGSALLTLTGYVLAGALFVYLAQYADVLKQSVVVASTAVWDNRSGTALHVMPAADDLAILHPMHELPCEDVATNFIDDIIYAADMIVPFIPLHLENRCEIGSGRETGVNDRGVWWWTLVPYRWNALWRFVGAVYMVVGWIFLSLALVTFSGVVKRIEASGEE